ncbi:unnamed protein product, partial [Heterosigma akashiwo]
PFQDSSVASELLVQAGQGDAEGLHGRERPGEVHAEQVPPKPAELQVRLAPVRLRHQLEVLHRGHGHPPVEVQHVGAQALRPHRGLVLEGPQVPLCRQGQP